MSSTVPLRPKHPDRDAGEHPAGGAVRDGQDLDRRGANVGVLRGLPRQPALAGETPSSSFFARRLLNRLG